MSLKDRIEAAGRRAIEGRPSATATQPTPAHLPLTDDPSLLSLTEMSAAISGLWFAMDWQAERSDGWHVMEIVADLERAWLGEGEKSAREGGFTEEDLEGFSAIGFLWEWIVSQAIVRRELAGDERKLFRPGEQELDGVFGTPDGVNLAEHALEEWKATWVSARCDIRERKRRWIVQMKAYCWMLGLRRANLRVLFVNGMYEKYKMGAPIVRIYRFVWTDEELQENWDMLMSHRDEMVIERKKSGSRKGD